MLVKSGYRNFTWIEEVGGLVMGQYTKESNIISKYAEDTNNLYANKKAADDAEKKLKELNGQKTANPLRTGLIVASVILGIGAVILIIKK